MVRAVFVLETDAPLGKRTRKRDEQPSFPRKRESNTLAGASRYSERAAFATRRPAGSGIVQVRDRKECLPRHHFLVVWWGGLPIPGHATAARSSEPGWIIARRWRFLPTTIPRVSHRLWLPPRKKASFPRRRESDATLRRPRRGRAGESRYSERTAFATRRPAGWRRAKNGAGSPPAPVY